MRERNAMQKVDEISGLFGISVEDVGRREREA